MKGMILTKIKEETGVEDLDDLRFFIGEVEGGDKNIEDYRRQKENGSKDWEKLSEFEMTRIRKGVEGLTDPEMRKIFESVFARGLAARKSTRGGEK
jgi:hypothetical protein